jgi:hypothetical protein
MAKMFQIGEHVLRESSRQLDRDNNRANIVMVYEPLLGATVPYERNPVRFGLMVEDPVIWDALKDAGTEPLIMMIDQEVQRYRAEKEAFVTSEGVPAPYPQLFPEVVEFLVDKDYQVVDIP